MHLVSLKNVGDQDVGRWSALAAAAAEGNPFVEPGFVLAAARAPGVRAPKLLIDEDGGAWRGCIPVRPKAPRGILGGALGYTTWTNRFSPVGTPLVAAGQEEAFAAALVGYLSSPRRSGYLTLRGATDAAVVAAIRAAVADSRRLATIFEWGTERAAVRRRADEDAHLVAMKPKRRREYEKRCRKLAEAVGSEVGVRDRSGDPEAIEEFLRLEASGWKGAEGTSLRAEGDEDVFRSICAAFAGQGRLQLLALAGEQETLAMQVNVNGGATLFNFKVAFDERFRRFAPGIQLEVEAMRIFHREREEELFDSCAAPENELLNRIYPDRLAVTTLVIGPAGPSGKAAGRLLAEHRRRQLRAAQR